MNAPGRKCYLNIMSNSSSPEKHVFHFTVAMKCLTDQVSLFTGGNKPSWEAWGPLITQVFQAGWSTFFLTHFQLPLMPFSPLISSRFCTPVLMEPYIKPH